MAHEWEMPRADMREWRKAEREEWETRGGGVFNRNLFYDKVRHLRGMTARERHLMVDLMPLLRWIADIDAELISVRKWMMEQPDPREPEVVMQYDDGLTPKKRKRGRPKGSKKAKKPEPQPTEPKVDNDDGTN